MADELAFGPFLTLAAPARAALAAAAHEIRFRPGDHLMRRGEPPDAAFALLAGRVRVVAESGVVLATMAAPALLGELAVLGDQARTADVVAVVAARTLRIPAADLRAVIAREPGFASAMASFADARHATAFLRKQSPFGDLPSSDIDRLAAAMRPYHAARGEVLLRQGEPGDDVFLTQSGEVDVLRDDGSGERLLSRLGPGAIIGEIAALTGSPRTATVRASTEVAALVVRGEDVRAVVKRHRALLDRVSSVMQARHAPARIGRHHMEPAPDDPGTVILHDPERGAYLRLDRQALAIFEDLDGERTLRDLAMRHLERTGTLDPHSVFGTVAALQVAGFATAPRMANDEPDARMLRVLDAVLAPRIEMPDADAAATRAHRALRPLFTRPAAVGALALGLGGIAAAIPVFRTASPLDFGVAGVVVAFVGLLLAGIGHEAAHALAAKAEGSRLGRAGIGLFWFTPVVYVDTSSTWAISRWARIRVNAAGPLFNLAVAGMCGLLARLTTGTTQDILVWLALTNAVLVVFNLSPLLEFDGYYVLVDLTDTNALRRKAMRFVFRDLVRRPRRPRSRGEAGSLAYVAACVVYVTVMALVAVSGVPKLVNGLLPSSIADGAREWIGLLVGLGLAASLLLPFVTEAVAARRPTELGAA